MAHLLRWELLHSRLSERLGPFFPGESLAEGAELYRQGAAVIRAGSRASAKGFVSAEGFSVSGPGYHPSLDLRAGVLHGWCDCDPVDESREACGHLWALLLVAERMGYLHDARYGPLRFEASRRRNQADGLSTQPAPPPIPRWKEQVNRLGKEHNSWVDAMPVWPPGREIFYVVNARRSDGKRDLYLELTMREPMKRGGLGRPRPLQLSRLAASRLPEPRDRELLALLAGSPGIYSTDYDDRHANIGDVVRLNGVRAELLAPKLCATGRCVLQVKSADDWVTLRWDDGPPYRLMLDVAEANRVWKVSGVLARDGESVPLSAIRASCQGGLVVFADKIARLDHGDSLAVLSHLRAFGGIEALKDHLDDLVGTLAATPGMPGLRLPASVNIEQVAGVPQPLLEISRPAGDALLKVTLAFRYGDQRIAGSHPGRGVYDSDNRRLILRDLEAESKAQERLLELGARWERARQFPHTTQLVLGEARLPALVRALVQEHWRIEADGKTFRRASQFRLDVSSGIDWFELRGAAHFDGASARLPELLKALARGDKMILLDDGTYGVLPEEWLADIQSLIGLGRMEGDHVRFAKNQAGILDVLLAQREDANWDEGFQNAREELGRFTGVEAAMQPKGFQGTLRGYQCEGLGWMEFLRRFRFGGCLADDMGVGKTAQVLALLETRRELRRTGEVGPSLAVVPKSLVFNWKQEAERFTPKLRVVDYTGLGRSSEVWHQADLIVTTYGTLRRDVIELKDFAFDYVILDEAQAIKNASSESAKAARLLKANHRLALSGTPVENHLGELWSLFEFLNPGMLGAASVFRAAGGSLRSADESTRTLLARSLRPFILRRTKQQVASELPPKTEQTLYCELEAPQRKLYNELRDHYRGSLLGRIERHGMSRSKMYVLEALLRLRQAACHPGLIDEERKSEASAKLDLLIPQIEEVLEEGHKALVFSQFVSFLEIVRSRLDADGIPYEYLDGSTRNRQERVERFQNDPHCKLFLISLKAGGLGLNLTAADYVFLLDPWWNPAVEAQAIDRTHRIGQSRHVFAYRLIAKDTVEEKVLALQNTKRDLADAIINQDNSLIRDLGRDDLELLLS